MQKSRFMNHEKHNLLLDHVHLGSLPSSHFPSQSVSVAVLFPLISPSWPVNAGAIEPLALLTYGGMTTAASLTVSTRGKFGPVNP